MRFLNKNKSSMKLSCVLTDSRSQFGRQPLQKSVFQAAGITRRSRAFLSVVFHKEVKGLTEGFGDTKVCWVLDQETQCLLVDLVRTVEAHQRRS